MRVARDAIPQFTYNPLTTAALGLRSTGEWSTGSTGGVVIDDGLDTGVRSRHLDEQTRDSNEAVESDHEPEPGGRVGLAPLPVVLEPAHGWAGGHEECTEERGDDDGQSAEEGNGLRVS